MKNEAKKKNKFFNLDMEILNQFPISYISNFYEKIILNDSNINYNFMEELKENSEDLNKNTIDWNKEMQLNNEILNLYKIENEKKEKKNNNSKKSIFITGATKFLGSYLVYEILNQYKDYKLYCLIRGENKENSLKKLIEDMKKPNLWNDNYLDRIKSFKKKKFFYLFFNLNNKKLSVVI